MICETGHRYVTIKNLIILGICFQVSTSAIITERDELAGSSSETENSEHLAHDNSEPSVSVGHLFITTQDSAKFEDDHWKANFIESNTIVDGQLPFVSNEAEVRILTITSITTSNIGTAVGSWLSDPTAATATYGDISTWDTSTVTNMYALFYGATTFNGNIAAWNTASVINMDFMFGLATSFNINIAAWKTASVISMYATFQEAVSFNENIAAWNTASVTEMGFMFYGATSFNYDLSNWNVAKVTSMNAMFYGASDFTQRLCWNIPSGTTTNGMFSYSSGSIACPTCLAGTYRAGSYGSCLACPAGSYCATSGLSAVSGMCISGKYSIASSTSCSSCLVGTYQVSAGSTTCASCTSGSYCATSGLSTVTGVCAAGKYSTSSSSACTSCPTGQYSISTGSSACASCSAGTYLESASCTSCSAGFYSSSSTQSSCTSCSAGYYSVTTGKNSVCTSTCTAGTYSAAGASACTSCSTGYYSSTFAQSSCSSCPAGTYTSTALFTIVSGFCTTSSSYIYSPNYPSDYNNYDSCSIRVNVAGILSSIAFSTESGYDELYVNSGGTSIIYSGTAGPSSESVAASSIVTFSSDGSITSSGWAIQLTAISGVTSCTSCASGYYSIISAQSSCSSCSAGYFSSSSAQSICSSCSAGYYSSTSAQSSCSSCLAGSYSSTSAQSSCSSCSAGYYSSTSAQSSCTSCTSGFFSTTTSKTSACTLTCSAGTYSASGASACSSCSAGYYSSTSAQSSCSSCSTGKSSSAAASSCSTSASCPAGKYSSNGYSTCTSCSAGYYSANSGATACASCPGGQYSSTFAQSSCSSCPAGTYSSTALFTVISGLCTTSGSYIYSPNFPSNYNNVDSCSITASVAGTLNSVAFSTESTFDKFTVTSGGMSIDYSGTTGPSSHSVTASSTITFTSDNSVVYSGWAIQLTVTTSDWSAATACASCSAGFYQPSSGQSSCLSCYSGYFCVSGASIYTVCPSGQYSSSGSSSCTSCSAGYYQPSSGQSSCWSCQGTTSGSSSCFGSKYSTSNNCDNGYATYISSSSNELKSSSNLFSVVSGDCGIGPNGTLYSHDFRESKNYSNAARCKVVLNADMNILFYFIDTQTGHDLLRIAGKTYSGHGCTEYAMYALDPLLAAVGYIQAKKGQMIVWSSDKSITAAGWVLQGVKNEYFLDMFLYSLLTKFIEAKTYVYVCIVSFFVILLWPCAVPFLGPALILLRRTVFRGELSAEQKLVLQVREAEVRAAGFHFTFEKKGSREDTSRAIVGKRVMVNYFDEINITSPLNENGNANKNCSSLCGCICEFLSCLFSLGASTILLFRSRRPFDGLRLNRRRGKIVAVSGYTSPAFDLLAQVCCVTSLGYPLCDFRNISGLTVTIEFDRDDEMGLTWISDASSSSNQEKSQSNTVIDVPLNGHVFLEDDLSADERIDRSSYFKEGISIKVRQDPYLDNDMGGEADVVRSVECFCSLTFEQLVSVVHCTGDVVFALDEKALTSLFHIIDACGDGGGDLCLEEILAAREKQTVIEFVLKAKSPDISILLGDDDDAVTNAFKEIAPNGNCDLSSWLQAFQTIRSRRLIFYKKQLIQDGHAYFGTAIAAGEESYSWPFSAVYRRYRESSLYFKGLDSDFYKYMQNHHPILACVSPSPENPLSRVQRTLILFSVIAFSVSLTAIQLIYLSVTFKYYATDDENSKKVFWTGLVFVSIPVYFVDKSCQLLTCPCLNEKEGHSSISSKKQCCDKRAKKNCWSVMKFLGSALIAQIALIGVLLLTIGIFLMHTKAAKEQGGGPSQVAVNVIQSWVLAFVIPMFTIFNPSPRIFNVSKKYNRFAFIRAFFRFMELSEWLSQRERVLNTIRNAIESRGETNFTNPIVAAQKEKEASLYLKSGASVKLKKAYDGIPAGSEGKCIRLLQDMKVFICCNEKEYLVPVGYLAFETAPKRLNLYEQVEGRESGDLELRHLDGDRLVDALALSTITTASVMAVDESGTTEAVYNFLLGATL